MRGRAAADFPQKVAGDDSIGRRAAYAFRGFGSDTARTHVANTAAYAAFAESALRFLRFSPVETGFNAVLLRFGEHLQRCAVGDFG